MPVAPMNAEAGPSTPPASPVALTPQPGTAAAKWYRPDGPPVGSTFGARILREDQDVFSQNAWDHVELPEDFHDSAEKVKEYHRSNPVIESRRDQYNCNPASYWDRFYSNHKAAFFKDRAWLRLEFPELIACSEADAGPKTVLEVGCGAGNTVFPLLMHNENPKLVVYSTDYSSTAVDVVKSNPLYPRPPHGKGVLHASVWDITARSGSNVAVEQPGANENHSTMTTREPSSPTASSFSLPEGIEPGSVDVITCIYVLSALHPKEWEQAVHNLYVALKPGGLLLLRDYGRHDLAQLRIKRERLLDPATPNLYIRGDGTRVYFFAKEELRDILTRHPREREGCMFELDQLGEDRRMLVNRKEQLKMFRIWMQVKAKKVVE